MPDFLDPLLAEIESINGEITDLSERMRRAEDALTAGGGDPSQRGAGAAVDWNKLTPDEHAVLWPQFVDWVIWMADRYQLTNAQVPRACWYRHGAVVEELTALWTSHGSAYAADDAGGGAAPYLWQDALARAIERINRLWLGSCRNGTHRDKDRQRWHGDPAYRDSILEAGNLLPDSASGQEPPVGPDKTKEPPA